MFFLIKFCLSFFVSFLILSIPINDQALFYLVHQATEPYTTEFISIVRRNTSRAVQETSEVGIKAFTNTRPKGDYGDQVHSKKSSVRRPESLSQTHDDYTNEEREMLNKIFESAH